MSPTMSCGAEGLAEPRPIRHHGSLGTAPAGPGPAAPHHHIFGRISPDEVRRGRWRPERDKEAGEGAAEEKEDENIAAKAPTDFQDGGGECDGANLEVGVEQHTHGAFTSEEIAAVIDEKADEKADGAKHDLGE
ncbi:hypothetical protein MTO96_043996 [Rhipicephalus appendiculatus]